MIPFIKIETLSDNDLLKLCETYGTKAKFWYRKFLGLLPEVNRRKVYEKRKCGSICEFAAKFGGVSKDQAERVVCIERTLRECGATKLREMLIEGGVSMHKLARIVSIVNKENEDVLVYAVKNLPQDALETFVKDWKLQMATVVEQEENKGGGKNGGNAMDFSPDDRLKTVRSHTSTSDKSQEQANVNFENIELRYVNLNALFNLGLDTEVVKRLSELKSKGFNINKLLTELLDVREQKIAEDKENIATKEDKKRKDGKEVTRRIPIKVKEILKEEFGTKCIAANCTRDVENIHHTGRFSITQSHNPYFLAPLCKRHHDIAHVMDEKFLEKKMR